MHLKALAGSLVIALPVTAVYLHYRHWAAIHQSQENLFSCKEAGVKAIDL